MADNAKDRTGHACIEIARHAVKGPFRDSTRASQVQCLLACTVFLLAWFNVISVTELDVGWAKLTVSLKVIAWLALIYGGYQLIRFLSEAMLELHLYSLEFEPIKAMAAEKIGEEQQVQNVHAEAFYATLDAFQRKIDENRAFCDSRDADIAEIEAAHRPRIDALKAKAEAFGPIDADAVNAPESLARVRERSDAYIELGEAQDDLYALLKPVRERPYPHTDMNEGNGLIGQSLRIYDMPTTKKIISAMKTSRRRGIMVAIMDITLPVVLFFVSVIIPLTVR